MSVYDSDPTKHGEGWKVGVIGDGGIAFNFSLFSGTSEFRLLLKEDRVIRRTLSRKDGNKDTTDARDQSTRGLTLFKTDRRNRIYTQGSRIWFQVAKRIQRSRYFTAKPVPAKAVRAMKKIGRAHV